MFVIQIVKEYLGRIYRWITGKPKKKFTGSKEYWESRYAKGGNSGYGSYGKLAQYKANILNDFVKMNNVSSIIEFGCGDGNQLKLSSYPKYLGFDISDISIQKCRKLFIKDTTKSFRLLSEYENETADLTLSLDVIYHLVEDEIFEDHISKLFEASQKFVIIYSSNTEENSGFAGTHIRHREFTKWIEEHCTDWSLLKIIPNLYPYNFKYKYGSFADFYIYKKNDSENKTT